MLYAFSRTKLKDNLAQAEKEALKPVNYVMTENGLEQQTDQNKNNPLAFSKIGNTLQEIKFTKPAVTDPATKIPLTIDEYLEKLRCVTGTKKQKKSTAPEGLPRRSPTPVLTGPCAA